MSAIYDMAGSLWHSMRSDYEAELEREFTAADNACHGYLVNRQGKAAEIYSPDRLHEHTNMRAENYWTTGKSTID